MPLFRKLNRLTPPPSPELVARGTLEKDGKSIRVICPHCCKVSLHGLIHRQPPTNYSRRQCPHCPEARWITTSPHRIVSKAKHKQATAGDHMTGV